MTLWFRMVFLLVFDNNDLHNLVFYCKLINKWSSSLIHYIAFILNSCHKNIKLQYLTHDIQDKDLDDNPLDRDVDNVFLVIFDIFESKNVEWSMNLDLDQILCHKNICIQAIDPNKAYYILDNSNCEEDFYLMDLDF